MKIFKNTKRLKNSTKNTSIVATLIQQLLAFCHIFFISQVYECVYVYSLHILILLNYLKVSYRYHDTSPLILQHASPKNEDALLHNKDNDITITLKKINNISKISSSHLHFNRYLPNLVLSFKFGDGSFRHYGGLMNEIFGE